MVPQYFQKFGRRERQRPEAAVPSLRVRLPDGRSLAIEEFGDPAGPVVLYFHGWPACRLEAGLIPDLPVRLLAFDRPGYGRSSPMPGRTLLDWPADVAFALDRLGLGRVHVIGLSGGGPYAAAFAYARPDRVAGLALVSPVPPADSVSVRAPGVGHLFRMGLRPRLTRRLFALARPLLRRRLITPRTVVGRGLPAADRAILDRTVMAGLARVWREGFGRGTQGALSDVEIYARDWGFRPADIRVPVTVWFGGQDSLIPEASLGAYRAIPGVDWRVLPDEGHYSLAIRHGLQILRDLTR